MDTEDVTNSIKERIKAYSRERVVFTKIKLTDWLCKRNRATLEELKEELFSPKSFVYAEKQTMAFEGKMEERFRCYFVFSQSRGRCYVAKFNHELKIITVFPLGRTTLKRYKRRFK